MEPTMYNVNQWTGIHLRCSDYDEVARLLHSLVSPPIPLLYMITVSKGLKLGIKCE